MSRDIRQRIKIHKITFSESLLKTIAEKKIPAFQNSIIVLDGDAKTCGKHNDKILYLPGESRPEDMFYNFLKELPRKHDFWSDVGGYTKQVCFRDRINIGNRIQMKEWFNEQLPHWGRGAARLLKIWKKANNKEVNKFNQDFIKALGTIKTP